MALAVPLMETTKALREGNFQIEIALVVPVADGARLMMGTKSGSDCARGPYTKHEHWQAARNSTAVAESLIHS